MKLEEFPPYLEGKAIAYVYQKPGAHSVAYMAKQKERQEVEVHTLEAFREATEDIGEILFLTRQQIDDVHLALAKEDMRPFSDKEREQLAA